MDPDETLRKLRDQVDVIQTEGADTPLEEELANLFLDLDGSLSKGGFLPKDWQR